MMHPNGGLRMKRTNRACITFSHLCPCGIRFGTTETNRFSSDTYKAAIARTLGHALDQHENIVADATWIWYDKKWDADWDLKRFDYAVEKGAKNCRNDAMIAAAKAGKFGEKLLKALVVAAGDAAEAFSEWVEKNSARYDSDEVR
jgi:hypothetical protein